MIKTFKIGNKTLKSGINESSGVEKNKLQIGNKNSKLETKIQNWKQTFQKLGINKQNIKIGIKTLKNWEQAKRTSKLGSKYLKLGTKLQTFEHIC